MRMVSRSASRIESAPPMASDSAPVTSGIMPEPNRVEISLVAEQLGRTLAPSPLLGSAVLAAQVILATQDENVRNAFLPKISNGSLIASLAWTDSEGGWDMFFTNWAGPDILNPVANASTNGRGKNGDWFGWADDPTIEAMRDAFARATSLEEQKKMYLRKGVLYRVSDAPPGPPSN